MLQSGCILFVSVTLKLCFCLFCCVLFCALLLLFLTVLQVVLEVENGSREEELFVAGRPFLICSGGVLGSFLKIRLF